MLRGIGRLASRYEEWNPKKLGRWLPPSLLGARRRHSGDAQSDISSTDYWSRYHVDAPDDGFTSVKESLDHFDWRNRLYPGYIELMPVDAADGLDVLDFGCGPGNDVIGFGHFSNPKCLFAADVSAASLRLAQQRAKLHGIPVEFLHIAETPVRLPLESASIDLIHSSGVIHHTPDPQGILRELRRVIRPGGYGQIMVYHHDSLWMHLYVAYQKMLREGQFAGLSMRDAYEKTMDGPGCPIAKCYTAEEFGSLVESCGFRCEFTGASMSTTELKLLPARFEALEDKRVNAESRKFLYELTFNDRHWPAHDGVIAGVNACFRIYPV